jgi:hypothetical protein
MVSSEAGAVKTAMVIGQAPNITAKLISDFRPLATNCANATQKGNVFGGRGCFGEQHS